MKKTLLLVMLVAFLMAANAHAAADVTLAPVMLSVIAGKSGSTTFNILNSGDTNLTEINLSVSALSGPSLLASTNLNLANSTIALEVSEDADIGMTINIPAGTPAGAYSGNITAQSDSMEVLGALSVTVVEANPDLAFSSSSITGGWIANYSTTSTLNVNITNTGNVDLTGVAISAGNLTYLGKVIENTKIAVSPATLNLAVGQKATVQFTISGLASNITCATYVGTVNATFGSESKTSTMSINVVPINRNLDFSSSLSGQWTANYTSEANLEVNLTNSGNVRLTGITTGVTDLYYLENYISGSKISVQPTGFDLEVGQTATLQIRIAGIAANQTAGTYYGFINASHAGGIEAAALSLQVAAMTYNIGIGSGVIDLGSVKLNQTVQKVLTISNDGNMPLSWIQVLNGTVDNKYKLWFNASAPFSLGIGQSKSVLMQAYMPYGTYTGNDIDLGDIVVKAQEYNESFEVSADIQGMLEMSKLTVNIDGKSTKDPTVGKGFDDTAKPGSEVEFTIKIENLFDDDVEDIEIGDIEMTIRIEKIDDGDDLEEEVSSFDLEASDTQTETVIFIIPYEVEEGTYDAVIEIEGEDEDGNLHIIERRYELELEKDKHDVILTKYDLSDEEVSCYRTVTVFTEIMNIGQRDEEDVKINVFNTQLGISEAVVVDELVSDYDDDDSRYSKQFSIVVGPTVSAGTYPISIAVYYDDGETTDGQAPYLVVKDCATGAPTTSASATSGTSAQASSSSQQSSSSSSSQSASPSAAATAVSNQSAAPATVQQQEPKPEVIVSVTPQASSPGASSSQIVHATTTSVPATPAQATSVASSGNVITSSSLGGASKDSAADGYLMLLVLANLLVVGLIALVVKKLFR